MATFDYKRPGDEQTLEGGGSGGGYSSKSKVFNDPADVAAAIGTGMMGLLGIKKGLSDANERAKLGADPKFVDPEYSHEGRSATKKAKGGSIKMAKGGTVSSASKRADGIAQRGKTRGRYL